MPALQAASWQFWHSRRAIELINGRINTLDQWESVEPEKNPLVELTWAQQLRINWLGVSSGISMSMDLFLSLISAFFALLHSSLQFVGVLLGGSPRSTANVSCADTRGSKMAGKLVKNDFPKLILKYSTDFDSGKKDLYVLCITGTSR